ncbi:hypothetical protein M405DRAFT_869999 [Rhizopogon salebrosus TDB-379]|nr:hypothetical protein M405DRAFT_869999 [Rhizopogon salebrosus TDB-379]
MFPPSVSGLCRSFDHISLVPVPIPTIIDALESPHSHRHSTTSPTPPSIVFHPQQPPFACCCPPLEDLSHTTTAFRTASSQDFIHHIRLVDSIISSPRSSHLEQQEPRYHNP